jgi:hypothetical protein
MISIRRKPMAAAVENGRVVVLCERLAEATRAGDAEWNREGDDVFIWKEAHGSVAIGSRDKDGEPPYELVVANADGDRLDELTSQLVDGDRPAGWNEPLAELYRSARRSALKADQVVDALIAALR